MKRFRLVFSGSGGQGVITASVILAEAAVLYEGLNAVQTQAYGPEARGGAARADVIVAAGAILYPKVLQPDVLVCLSQKAYDKYVTALRPGGTLLTDRHFVTTDRRVDALRVELDLFETVRSEVGNTVTLNMCMLGAVLNVTRLVRLESVDRVLGRRVPGDFLEMNRKALRLGWSLAEGRPDWRGERKE